MQVSDRKNEGLEAAIDLLLRWGSDELAFDGTDNNAPADLLSFPVADDE